jgi:hypothetical protein
MVLVPNEKDCFMNRIVREHYPVSALPDDLRAGLGDATHVRLVVEYGAEDEALLADLDQKLHKAMADLDAGRGLTADEVRKEMKTRAAARTAHAG